MSYEDGVDVPEGYSLVEGYAYFESDSNTESVKGYELTVEGCPIDDTRMVNNTTYAGGWARKVMESSTGLTLGYQETETEVTPISIPNNQGYNFLIMGNTGSGKSVLQQNLLIQIAEQGYGFCYLDRTSTENPLLNLSEDRLDDVVLFELDDEEDLNIDHFKEVVKDGKIALFQPSGYIPEEKISFTDIIKKLVSARIEVESDDPYYLAWDHMYNISEETLPRSILHDLLSRPDHNIGTIFTANRIEGFHSRESTRDLIIGESDVQVGFYTSETERNRAGIENKLDIYSTEARQQICGELDDYEAMVSAPMFDIPVVVESFAPYPPRHTEQEVYSGPLLRYVL